MFEPPEVKRPVQWVAHEAKSLPEVLLRRVAATPDRPAYLTKRGGSWVATTWQTFHDQCAALATFLIDRGLAPGDKICIVGSTRPEWCVSDIGGLMAGAVTVGAYPTLAPAQLKYILDHSDSRFVFVESKADLDKVLAHRAELPKLQGIIVWDTTGVNMGGEMLSMDEVLRTRPDLDRIRARVETIDPAATAIIVYTSGTTGDPKGAMIGHDNILALLKGIEPLIPLDQDDIGFSFLPMAHVAERIASFYARINSGIANAYATSIPAVLEEVKEVRPTVFGSVPRIFEKAYAKIMSEVAKAPPPKQKIFRYAERVGREAVRRWQRGERIPLGLQLQYRLVDRLVFRKIREAFGGRVKHFVTGAAPISMEILEFFWACGFPIYEVYGMTEATVITHANTIGDVKLGTVGKPIPVIQDRLAEDGEILIHGATVFKGYYKNPEATAEAVDRDGWLHTGDIGRREPTGHLKIVDRKKHIIITSGGKNITPANIENEIKSQDPLISQVHVHGDRRPYLTGIVTIHPIEAIEWAKSKGLLSDPAAAEAIVKELMQNPFARPAGLAEIMRTVTGHPEIRQRMVAAIQRANANLSRVETVKRIAILERDFSLEEDEITPTMKVKRKEVEKKYMPLFDRLYTDSSFGLTIEPGGGETVA